MDRRVQWKSKPLKFESQEARLVRADRQQARRQNKREEQRNQRRCVSPVEETEEEFEDTPENRAIRLEKWKKERDLKKKLEAKKKRPAFVIGVPHHNFYSPASRDPAKPHCHRKPKEPSPPKRVTAVTQRRLAAKAATAAQDSPQPSTSGAQVRGKTRTSQTPLQPRVTRSRRKAMEAEKQTEKKVEKKKTSLAPQNYEFKGPTGIAPIPLFGEMIIPGIDIFNFNLNDNPSDKKNIRDDQQALITSQEKNEKTPSKPIKLPKKESQDEIIKEPTGIMTKQVSTQADSSIESVVLRMSSEFEPPKQPDQEVEQEKENIKMVIDSNPSPRSFSPVPAEFSPFIVASRGKSSARKEQKQRLSLHKNCSPKDEIPTKDTVMQNLNISIEEEEKTAQYYKHLLKSEEGRLTSLCATWRLMQEDPNTPEDSIYVINQAIGQTNLLIRKKFAKFAELVLTCETGKGEQLVCSADLRGFWEMMEMEIRDCNLRFSKLEKLKSREWKEEEEEFEVKITKKKSVAKRKKIEGKSNMKSFIEAQRRKKKAEANQETVMEEDVPEVNNEQSKVETKQSSVTPRKSLPKPVSPHSRARLTPRTERTSLLKQVQLTESAKRITQNSHIMYKASQKGKTPEVKHDQSISYINSSQTPGKGILKKTEDAPKSEGRLSKPTHKVNFNDTVGISELPEEELDEIEQNKRSLAESLARIDSLDFGHDDEEVCVNKKLDFEDDCDDDVDDVFVDNVPSTETEPETPEGGLESIQSDAEMEEKIEASRLSPTIEMSTPLPPEKVMLRPTAVKSPGEGESSRSGCIPLASTLPIIKITEPTPQVPKVSETITTLHRVSLDLEIVSPSPVKSPRKVKNKRTEEIKNESIVNIDMKTPEKKSSRKERIESFIDLVTPETPENLPSKLITPKSGKLKARAETTLLDETPSTPKSPKRGRKKSNVNLGDEKIDDSDEGRVSISKTPKKSAQKNPPEAAVVESFSPPKRQLRNRLVPLDNVTMRKRRNSAQKRHEDSIIGKETNNSDETGNKENSYGLENNTFQSPKTPRDFAHLESPSVRRSARKSVRFVPEDDCTVCKPVPLTPRSLMKARMSFFGESEIISQPLPNGDLMAFDSPKTPRTRVRRSSMK